MKLNLIDTIDFFIRQMEGDLEDLGWQIREETNYEDCNLDWLSEQCETAEQHLENLQKIKSAIEILEIDEEEK
jgi:hypothetical protein